MYSYLSFGHGGFVRGQIRREYTNEEYKQRRPGRFDHDSSGVYGGECKYEATR